MLEDIFKSYPQNYTIMNITRIDFKHLFQTGKLVN